MIHRGMESRQAAEHGLRRLEVNAQRVCLSILATERAGSAAEKADEEMKKEELLSFFIPHSPFFLLHFFSCHILQAHPLRRIDLASLPDRDYN